MRSMMKPRPKKMRVTITLDDHLAERVRQRFEGNLSKGINTLLQRELETKRKSMFGALKGHRLTDTLKQIETEEIEAEKEHEKLYRGLARADGLLPGRRVRKRHD